MMIDLEHVEIDPYATLKIMDVILITCKNPLKFKNPAFLIIYGFF